MSKKRAPGYIEERMGRFDYVGKVTEINSFCKKEGLSQVVIKKLQNAISNTDYMTCKYLGELLEKYKRLFESYGYGPEEYLKYMNEYAVIYEMSPTTLKYNFALYDYAGVLEYVIFEDPYTLPKNHNPKDLYAIIKWLKDSKEAQRGITLLEIGWYLDNLPLQALRELRSTYPLTISKYGLIESRHEALINARLKGNKAYVKSFSIPDSETE